MDSVASGMEDSAMEVWDMEVWAMVAWDTEVWVMEALVDTVNYYFNLKT